MTGGRAHHAVAALIASAVAVQAPGLAAETSTPTGTPMSVEELDGEIARRQGDIDRARARAQALEPEIARVRADLERREEALSRQRSQVRSRVLTLCQLNEGGYLQVLRGARSWVDAVRRLRHAQSVAAEDVSALRAHQGEVDELARRRRELDQTVAAQRQLIEQIASYQQELRDERARRLAGDPSSAFAPSTGFAEAEGGLEFPIDGPSRLERRRRGARATRIVARAGAEVVVVHDGVVRSVRDGGGSGWEVTVDHGDGYTTSYRGMAPAEVWPGQPVARGQRLGEVSGETETPTLLFALIHQGRSVDPTSWLGL